MNELEKLRAWKQLKEMLSKIYDPDTRHMYYRALLVRATSDWGFNPDKPTDAITTPDSIELNDWEKEFVEDIKDSIVFGFNVRAEKSRQTDSDCYASMMRFVRDGGALKDIPENLRCETIDTLYRECRDRYHQEFMDLADYVINKN